MTRNDDSSGETFDRRSVLKGVGATGAAAVGAGAATQPVVAGKSGDCEDPDYSKPAIFTGDHIAQYHSGHLVYTEGNDSTNYEQRGDWPDETPEEIVIHVHGWRNGVDCGYHRTELIREAYAVEDYDGFVAGLVWDSSYGWGTSKSIAELNALKLANFITDYKEANPDTTIRLQGHSLGARVVAETVLELDHQEEYDVLTSVIFMVGAIDNTSVAVSGEYGPALERVAQHVENFWQDDDTILDWAYRIREFSSAIGNDGCDGVPPANYSDHEVQLDDHSDHYKPHVGIVDKVMETFETEEEGDNIVDDDESNIGEGDSGFSMCFITTATHREPETLDSLRRFRDESMAVTPIGKFLVWLYYYISPPIAQTLEENPDSRTTNAVRSLVQHCASLSNAQAETNSRLKSMLLGVYLTVLYMQGILLAAGGHLFHRTADLVTSDDNGGTDRIEQPVE